MAIPAKRFKHLSRQTNLPIFDFIDSRLSGILNQTIDVINEVSGLLGSLASGEVVDGIKDTITDIEDGISSTIREAEDGLSSIIDTAKDSLDDVIDKVMPVGDELETAIKTSVSDIKELIGNNASIKDVVQARAVLGDTTVKGVTTTDVKVIRDLRKISNTIKESGIANEITDTTRLQTLVETLTKKASEYNLPNYFSDLSTVFESDEDAGRPASEVFKYLASTGNISGIIDLGGSRAAIYIGPNNPNATNEIFMNYRTPAELSEQFLDSFTDVVVITMDKIDPEWGTVTSGDKKIISAKASVLNSTKGWTSTLEASINNNDVNFDETDTINDRVFQLSGTYSSYSGNDTVNGSTLNDAITTQMMPASSTKSIIADDYLRIQTQWGSMFDLGTNAIRA